MRKLAVSSLAIAVISLAASSAYAAFGDGLVSYWPFDGDLNDAAGSNHGTLMGADTTAVYDSGKFGQGIDLDGIDQFVDVGNDASLDMSVGGAGAQTGSVSISAWLRVDAFDKDWQALIAKGEGNAYRIARRANSDNLAYAGGSGDIPNDNIGPNVNDRGNLHHVLAISENGVSTRLWVDGGLVATGDPPTISNEGNTPDSNPNLWIGDNPQAVGRSWNGLIDDVGIWNRALSEYEVGAIYSSGGSLRTLLIPEPSTFLLLGASLGALIAFRRRR